MNALGFGIASWLALRLPRKTAYSLAERIAESYAFGQARERRSVQDNLRQITGRDLGRDELFFLTREVYRNFAKHLVDFFRMGKVNDSFLRDHVSLEGTDELIEVLRHKRGGILLTAHLGSWEIGGAILAGLGHGIDVIALSHKNSWLDRFFLNQRSAKGIHSFPLHSALKGSLAGLKQNRLIGILGDRDYTHQGIPVQFLGKSVSFPKGTAYLALKTGSPIIPVFILRREDDGIRVLCQKPIPHDGSRQFSEEGLSALTQQCARVIEHQIRLHPTQWLVFRRFWEPI